MDKTFVYRGEIPVKNLSLEKPYLVISGTTYLAVNSFTEEEAATRHASYLRARNNIPYFTALLLEEHLVE